MEVVVDRGGRLLPWRRGRVGSFGADPGHAGVGEFGGRKGVDGGRYVALVSLTVVRRLPARQEGVVLGWGWGGWQGKEERG